MPIEHLIVLMLENRSFDTMLGRLYPASADFDGLPPDAFNTWHKPDGTTRREPVWNDPQMNDVTACLPNPDPGESFDDIRMQIHGLPGTGAGGPTMSGFADNYAMHLTGSPPPEPNGVMHCFTPEQVPVISTLAIHFGVSDRWFASAPCQTWPNRFFAHCATAGGYVNNAPSKLPFEMPTVFNQLDAVGKSWRLYRHDMPQTMTLSRLWDSVATHFKPFSAFAADAAAGNLPSYSFIEPRYFADIPGLVMPNDQHPPHNVVYGEQLIAAVYNAVRAAPTWSSSMLVITYDEHGGCFDHVPPPPAIAPGGPTPDGFAFDYYGVRVPAVIVSPYVKPGSVIRPAGPWPFDHTSISATLQRLFGTAPLTRRDASSPHLLDGLTDTPDNNALPQVQAPTPTVTGATVAAAAAVPPNALQRSLTAAQAHAAVTQGPTFVEHPPADTGG